MNLHSELLDFSVFFFFFFGTPFPPFQLVSQSCCLYLGLFATGPQLMGFPPARSVFRCPHLLLASGFVPLSQLVRLLRLVNRACVAEPWNSSFPYLVFRFTCVGLYTKERPPPVVMVTPFFFSVFT